MWSDHFNNDAQKFSSGHSVYNNYNNYHHSWSHIILKLFALVFISAANYWSDSYHIELQTVTSIVVGLHDMSYQISSTEIFTFIYRSYLIILNDI